MVKITEDYIKTLISKKSFNDENFPVSSFLIDSKKGVHIRNFYHFARISDDIADNMLLDSSEKVRILKYFDNLLLERKENNLKFMNNLIFTLNNQNLSSENPRKLLKAFLMDSTKLRYKNWDELINYCNHSASPVGRFVVDLHLTNHSHEKIKKIYLGTDRLCNCLQILNHLQDIKKDFERLNRIYLPMNYFKYEKLEISCLTQNFAVNPLLRVIKKCLTKVDIILSESEKYLVTITNKKLLRETMVIFLIAKKLSKLLAKNDPLKKKIKLSRIDLIFCFFKGIIKGF